MGGLSQPVTVTQVEESDINIEFYYRSGICFFIRGSKSFSTNEGVRNNNRNFSDQACYRKDSTVTQGTQAPLNVIAFERYPDTAVDLATFIIDNSLSDYLSPNLTDIVIKIADTVSGSPSLERYDYSPTSVLLPNRTVPTQVGLAYNMTPGEPRTSFPFNLFFDVYIERTDAPDVYSTAELHWYIPIIGSRANELPNYYPVSTDPDLIFMIIRDPPGGGSFVKVAGDTSHDFFMSIEGMDTYSGESKIDAKVTVRLSLPR